MESDGIYSQPIDFVTKRYLFCFDSQGYSEGKLIVEGGGACVFTKIQNYD